MVSSNKALVGNGKLQGYYSVHEGDKVKIIIARFLAGILKTQGWICKKTKDDNEWIGMDSSEDNAAIFRIYSDNGNYKLRLDGTDKWVVLQGHWYNLRETQENSIFELVEHSDWINNSLGHSIKNIGNNYEMCIGYKNDANGKNEGFTARCSFMLIDD